MEMFVGGEWRTGVAEEIRSPYTGEVVGSAPVATIEDVEMALATAVEGARTMRALPAHERADILARAADRVAAHTDELAEIITSEEGKPIGEAVGEATRIPGLLQLCAGEALRQSGEVLPMDAAAIGEGRLGFTVPEPCGVVVAISPFNFPALLSMHKIGPALAAGNAVIHKPARATPLTALYLTRHLIEAGVPPQALQCIPGPGAIVGEALCSDRRVRKVSFTGSRDVGERITRVAGLKRITCELGSNAALVVFDDADIDAAASATARSGFVNAGQVCISAQRVLVPTRVLDAFLQGLLTQLDALKMGDPRSPETTLGPMISTSEALRVRTWIDQAEASGAEITRSGEGDGAFVEPTVILQPASSTNVWCEELFGPAVAVRSFSDEAEALRLANDTRYGLAVGVFTQDIDRAIRFAREARSGVVHVNSGPLWRTDFMPYGGVGESGYGREGVKFAMQEMTEQKLVVIHPGSS